MLAALTFILFYTIFTNVPEQELRYEIPYSQFKSLLKEQRVEKVILRGNIADGQLFDAEPIGPQDAKSKRFRTRIPSFGDETLLPELEAEGVEVIVGKAPEENLLTSFLFGLLPWVLFFLIFMWIMRRAARNLGGGLGGPGELKRFLESTPGKSGEIPKVTFHDVAGQENAKREVSELVDYLKQPEKYRELGAEIPRGVLLMGPPGTGKTLMAKALAGEAGVPFYSISASEFIEVFVGVGAARVRRLFEAAKKSAPSIIFIDELDSIGRTRGTGLGGGHDEREQTLNQILAELDGFSPHEAVLVLAASNRPDVLDPALLRPGRFDRHVILDLPDLNERQAILALYTGKIPLADDVDLARLAAGTAGFSGADLKNLVNEAAILAARANQKQVSMTHFDEARDKVMMGTERTLAIEPEEQHRLAVHEAGHTVVAYFLPHADPIYKVSIIPRGQALGATQQLPEHERHTLPEDYLRDRLVVMLAGRTAEKMLLGTVSSGADNDIHQATVMARAMVSRWGMSKEVGPVDLRESEEHPFLGREIAQPRHYSEHSAEIVDHAVQQLLLEAEKRATEMLDRHRTKLDRLVESLEKHETLAREAIEECLGPAPKGPRHLANRQDPIRARADIIDASPQQLTLPADTPREDTVNLFSPLALGPYTLPNRVFMAPMTRNRAPETVPTPLMATYYAQRAGAGLIISEASQISPQGVGYPATPGIHSDVQVQGWQGITDAVHEKGGHIFLQLWHVGRISHPDLQPDGALPVAPSAILPAGEAITYGGAKPFVTPRALENEEIPAIVRQYGEAAENAQRAGFDGVEIHAANGYLIDQFLRDGANQRSDRYGGSLENRARFLLEVTQAVVDVWGADRVGVGVRLSPLQPFNDMRDS
ncbi:MAG: ATP-dependent zinc metalloprotease FtsH, partial [Gammaproteobacteria bacterium]